MAAGKELPAGYARGTVEKKRFTFFIRIAAAYEMRAIRTAAQWRRAERSLVAEHHITRKIDVKAVFGLGNVFFNRACVEIILEIAAAARRLSLTPAEQQEECCGGREKTDFSHGILLSY